MTGYTWVTLQCILLTWLGSVLVTQQAVITMATVSYTAEEGTQVAVFVRKTGVAASSINVVVQVEDPYTQGGLDFIGTSQTTVFSPGTTEQTREVMFTVRDDAIPEPDEVFGLRLVVTNGDGITASPDRGQITIVANDDGFGIFGFSAQEWPVTTEELDVDHEVALLLQRTKGAYGTVVLQYQVLPSQQPAPDLGPVSGSVTFYQGESSKQLPLTVYADTVSEADESFTVQLTEATGGDSVSRASNRPQINTTHSQATIVIRQNDAPVRFSRAEFRVEEGSFESTLRINVFRGTERDGISLIGPINTPASVSFYLQPITATPGADYIAVNGSVGFSPGVTHSLLNIQILSDTLPEVAETFQIVLTNPTGDIVLAEPSTCTIIINANDDFNGVLSLKTKADEPYPKVIVNEDAVLSVNDFIIYRSGGSYGVVSVEWVLVHNNTANGGSGDVLPSVGTAVLLEGQVQSHIQLEIVQDNVPEPTERYFLRLLPGSTTGGARAEGVLQAELIIQDSDQAHGMVEFTSPTAQRLVTTTSPRKLVVSLVRTGGILGTLEVDYNVTYTSKGVPRTGILLSKVPGTILFSADESSLSYEIWIKDEAFLEVDSVFLVSLTGIRLSDAHDVGPYNTPRLGQSVSIEVPVTIEAANGEVGFDITTTQHVLEPDGVLGVVNKVTIPVSRVGTNGEVLLHWRLSGSGSNPDHVTTSDVQPQSGTLRMVSGQTTAKIIIDILSDDLPEMDEQFSVTLTSLEPSETQRLRPGAAQVTMVITENDSPGGMFEFSNQTAEIYTVQEEVDAVEVTILRSGGALVERQIEYYIEPNGDNEFYGGTNVLKFLPGQVEQNITVLAKGDGIPELTEQFVMRLRSFGEKSAVIGPHSSLRITVLSNEQPYGIFMFSAINFTTFVNETKGADVIYAHVPVLRQMGRFGMATLDWSLLDADVNVDLSPVRGTLTFDPGVGVVDIKMQVVADELPETDEVFYVNITNPTGSAQLGEAVTASVVILENDDPIYFQGPTRLEVGEPGTYNVTVARGGRRDSEARVKYRTVDGSATEAGRDYVIITEEEFVFAVGDYEKIIVVTVLEDLVPEPDEVFFVELFDAKGDVAVHGPQTEVIIMSNDQSNGIFRFSPPYHQTQQEGSPAQFEIYRDAGVFGGAYVYYEIYDNETGELLVNSDFEASPGRYMTFADRDRLGDLFITPLKDNVPEYNEVFRIVLYNVSGGRPEDPGLLADHSLTAYLTVLQNDDPFGVFIFSDNSREMSIAEDFYEGSENTTRTDVLVERKQGSFNTVQVLWEVFSYQIAGAGNLPVLIDLLFVGDVPVTVPDVPHIERPGTGTKVLRFSGCPGCYVTVPPQHHTAKADIENGFSLSAWIQPENNMDGYLLAKTTGDGSRVYYAVKLLTSRIGDFYSFTIRFQYSVKNNPKMSEEQVLALDMADGGWHFVLLCVDNGQVFFYVDGTARGTRFLDVESSPDGPGVLLVGAMSPGVQHYQGLMQDVRVYSRKLNENEIRELYETPSTFDLFQISGYLTLTEGQTTQNLRLQARDDNEEEANDVFSVKLISASNGARISENDATSTLTVLKSDNANGLFGFSGMCIPLFAGREDTTFNCPVTRRRGDTDSVTVSWEITGGSGDQRIPAYSDFRNATGEIMFAPGERQKMLTFYGLDDDVPELEEVFYVMLRYAASSDGLIGSTDQSGASIDPAVQTNNITLADNDYPYGLLQFSLTESPPQEGRLHPATKQPTVAVPEEVGTRSLMVVRAQGTLGRVTVEWRTVDGTAKSSGKSPPDYLAQVSVLTFDPGQLYQYVNVTLLDNNIPESDKYFFVELVNPTGGAAVGLGSEIRVVIRHSDQAYGVFLFDEASSTLQAEELGDTGYNVVELKIIREGGSIGAVNVSWKVADDKNNDLVVTSGWVTFVDGQTEGQITVQIRGDTVPELEETFVIMLTNSTEGSLGNDAQTTSELTIEANDDPYGLFIIMQTFRPVRVEEGNVISITVERKSSSGQYGTVRVDYHTLDPWELYTFLPGGTVRADLVDFQNESGSVVMEQGERQASFNVTIRDDDTPEVEESVFVRLSAVYLVTEEGQGASPTLGENTETYAQIIIEQNDSPNGVLELSAADVAVSEDHVGPLVSVVRTAGAFGAVTVKFEVIQGTAIYGLDYSVSSTDILLLSGERQKRIPVDIVNDGIPETAENFVIRLLGQVNGGATLGTVTSCRVTIEKSDDLHGAFGFESDALAVEEQTEADKSTVQIPVVRLGGTQGLVSVDWQATLNGQSADSDISPASGIVYFVSNQARQMISVAVLPDQRPEGLENIEFMLLSANNGGRIDPERRNFTLRILPNDNPHGTLEFKQNNFFVNELETDTPQYVPISRRGGSYGDLRVHFYTSELDLSELAIKHGRSLLDYFLVPEPGVGPKDLPSGTSWDVSNQPQPLTACTNFCLLTEACLAFYYSADLVQCYWFTVSDQQYLDNRTGYFFYVKDQPKTNPLYAVQAKSGLDFRALSGVSITIPDGSTEGMLPVIIYPDNIPELNEQFTIKVTKVELLDELPVNPLNLPQLGQETMASVTIATNDDANGVFRIYSNDLRAEENGKKVLVEEREKFAVELLVAREGGSIGTVSVSWFVIQDRTTASSGEDFKADGATLTFEPGQIYRTITIGVEDDRIPEDDETIVVGLRNSLGGAVLGPYDHVTITIGANDHVAGLLSFKETSNLVREGDLLTLTLLRSAPARGIVLVNWRIVTTDNRPVKGRFRISAGQLYFRDGEKDKDILLHVQVDNQPKINQEYTVQLSNIVTNDVRVTGAAAADPQRGEAHITIEGGNQPHGLFNFAPNILERPSRVYEGIGTYNLSVERKYGAIGIVQLYYDIRIGAIQTLSNALDLASPGSDFVAVTSSTIMFGDGQNSGAISIQIEDDTEPEVDEVFVVELTRVELVEPKSSTFRPKIEQEVSVAEVIINANDGTQGEVIFAPNSQNVSVEEAATNISLVIQRQRGTFGSVSVYCYAQNAVSNPRVAGAILGEDFKFQAKDLLFGPGEAEKVVVITITQDNLPEPDESLEVILDSPKQGLILGQPHKATVTILGNDMASGVVSFETPSNVTINEPLTLGAEGSRASLVVVRGPGIFGVVTVHFRVVAAGADADMPDIVPASGVITFQDKEATTTLDLSAVPDNIPEEAEVFYVYLSQPEGGATIGLIQRKTVIVERNDAPYGLLEIYQSVSRNSSLTVEENVGMLYFDVVRNHGDLGRVSVDMVTIPGTARALTGSNITMSTIQQIDDKMATSWYSYDFGGLPYVIMLNKEWVGPMLSAVGSAGTSLAARRGSITPSSLYRWQGVLTAVQTIETDGASAAEAFTINGTTYLFIANFGQNSRHSTKSRMYKVQLNGSLILVQEFSTRGATDATYFQYAGQHYLFISNYQDNQGQTNIRSDLYRWESTNQRMSSLPIRYLDTVGASAVETLHIDGEVYLIVASHMDSDARSFELKSTVFKFDISRELVVHQQVQTEGATDLTSFQTDTSSYLVIANQRDNFGDTENYVHIYSWNSLSKQFVLIQEILSVNVQKIHTFWMPGNTKYYLVVVSSEADSELYEWDTSVGQFSKVWSGSSYLDLYPVVIPQTQGDMVIFVEAPDVADLSTINIHQVAYLSHSDYFPRDVTVTFEPGQTRLQLSVSVFNDQIPEDTENFRIKLVNVRYGAELGTKQEAMVNILSNDNGHGIVQFANDSLIHHAEEMVGKDNVVQLNVVRDQGTSGRVVVQWTASGDHQGIYDINPIQGRLEFADGQSAATISITIRDDGVAEVDEVSLISLVEVLESGTQIPGRGAVIGTRSVSRLVVLANDSPYGVVHWEVTNVTSPEPDIPSSTVTMAITRSQGTSGHIRVTYITQPAVDQEAAHQAVSGLDYVASQDTVDMEDGVTSATAEISLLGDSVPEVDEYFWVNITDVYLVVGVPQNPPGGSRPSVRRPGNIVTVRIKENDNARGTIYFNITRNVEGRVDVYEGIDTIRLPLVRSVGYFGVAEVTWQAVPREADTSDFSPSGGTVRFEEDQMVAMIEIAIIDDYLPENIETFDVQLLTVTSGGAVLGTDTSVRIGIVKNDSPNGVFSFLPVQQYVKESVSLEDPQGVVSFDVVRRGTDGEVTIQWRLSPDAVDDFVLPHAGTIIFEAGETRKSISVRTLPDDLLEGQEEYTLSLVSATNNADISPTEGEASIVILPDSGSGGVLSVQSRSSTVYIGEPVQGYDGTSLVHIQRSVGTHGEVTVSWQLTQRDFTAFTQVQGQVVMRDMQTNASITLQASDDSLPEAQDSFTLELITATGGATIDPRQRTARVVMVASDHPHGLFEFSEPSVVTVEEKFGQISVAVERHAGLTGQVQAYYTTHTGSAHSDVTDSPDYQMSSGWLMFSEGDIKKTVNILILDDKEAEGPESFYVNLTKIELLSPRNNNYSDINGLSLDMAPEIGPLSVKTIVISKNDMAEGVVQFHASAVGLVGHEEQRMVSIPVVRGPGFFGEVSATYQTADITALLGQDYSVTQNKVLFLDGQATSYINITIVNDDLREFDETFRVELVAAEGGATLGVLQKIVVTIAKSDYPNGKFGFESPVERTVTNPEFQTEVPVTIERSEGVLAKQKVLWRIMGPNDPNRILEETNDIGFFDNTISMETTGGEMSWEANEDGVKGFALQVKPHSGWEIEKTYIIMIYDIQGFPADQGSGQTSPTSGNLTLTIGKFGFPNGIIRFDGLAQVPRRLDEPGEGLVSMIFPLVRREGTIGTLQVYWQVIQTPSSQNPNVTADVFAGSGKVTVAPGVSTAEIVSQILADDVPELDESFLVVLTRIEGGADIDTQYNTSRFTISHNDAPHGRFSILSEKQTIVVEPQTLRRRMRLNITRNAGRFGKVRLNFAMKYDQAEPGLSYSPATGSVMFNDNQSHAVVFVGLESQRFLRLNSTFSVTLVEVTLVGNTDAEPPVIIVLRSAAKVIVPMEAANSEIGFLDRVVSVNEEIGIAQIIMHRQGAYGGLSIAWVSGYHGDDLPPGYNKGALSPLAGDLTMRDRLPMTTFSVQLIPQLGTPELFAIHLATQPLTSAPGGARVWSGRDLCRIEPHGVVRFSVDSRNVVVTESDTVNVEVTLDIDRVYGSQDAIQIRYQTVSGTAVGGADYRHIQSGALTMEPQQTRSSIFIEIFKDEDPETDEYFYVNLTSVSRLPTSIEQDVSPRLSTDNSNSTVTIRSSNDPYGVFSVSVDTGESDKKASEPGRVTLTVKRTGGVFGQVTLKVRTVGGGEPWDRLIEESLPGGLVPDTIGEALGGRGNSMKAVAGQDYQRLDTTLVFKEGEVEKTVSLYIIDDIEPEEDETLFVYLNIDTNGARVARPSLDNGLRGFTQITIRRNDFWNGWLGFYLANSSKVTVDEDSGIPITLTVERRNASIGTIKIYWRAVAEPGSDSARSERIDLHEQLVSTTGIIQCRASVRFCNFQIAIKNDKVPENGTWFLVELYLTESQSQTGATIDQGRRFANITILPSDYPDGLLEFKVSSRFVYINRNEQKVTLRVARQGYTSKTVSVTYRSESFPNPQQVAGVSIYPALAGADYDSVSSVLVFQPGETEHTINITRDPLKASDNPYPKSFRVVLEQATGGAVLGTSSSSVTITDAADVVLWQLWPQSQASLDNNTISSLMRTLRTFVQNELSISQLSVVKNILDKVLGNAEKGGLQQSAQSDIASVFCKLLNSSRHDATRGHWQLSQYLERFVYSYVAHLKCDTCCQEQFLESPECKYVRFTIAKRYPEDVNSYKWTSSSKDYLTLPQDLLRVQDHGRLSGAPKCYPLAFIEYSSSLWFPQITSTTILNNKVLSASIKDEPSRSLSLPVKFRIHTQGAETPSQRAECTYFEESITQWTTGARFGNEVCSVQNNLALAIDNYVDCSCNHFSLYAVKSETRDADKIGYPIWFHISCFICIAGMALTILAHHVCNLYTLFSSNLLMHMCFAVLATEVCYVIDAYSSPDHLLNIGEEDNNYRCIVMSLFLHYFYLTQFTWMMTQAINMFKVLVLNDEHTERKYVTYFLVGWGLPLLVVAVFYIVAYLIYRYLTDLPISRIYGDVLGTRDICFVTNPISGLAGVVVPSILCLMVVGVVFIQAFQITAQWQSYDDIYRGRYNIHEVRFLLLFFALLVMVWLWGGLHMAYGQLWMLVLFCIFNIATGVYVFILYTALRNPCLPCLKPQKPVYSINTSLSEVSEAPFEPRSRSVAAESLKSSRHTSVPEEPWQKETIAQPMSTNSMLRVKRSPANGNIYIIPPTPHSTKALSGAASQADTQDLDDLILALRTGAVVSPSDSMYPADTHDFAPTDSSMGSRIERKHISIADTHL